MLNNLRAIDAQLATIESEQARALPHNNDENELADDSPHGLSDIWLRLSRHFTPESALPSCGKNVAGVVLRLRHHSDNRNASRVLDLADKFVCLPAKL